MTDLSTAPDCHVYTVSRGGAAFFAAVFLVGGAVLIWRFWPMLEMIDPASALTALLMAPARGLLLMALIVFPATGLTLAFVSKALGAVRGLPRLAVTKDGITLTTLFGTKRANWSSLGPFEAIRYTRGGHRAEAEFVGPDESGKRFAIPDVFSIDPDQMVPELNAWRAQALGLPPPAAEDPQDVGSGATLALVAMATFAVMLPIVAVVLRHYPSWL